LYISKTENKNYFKETLNVNFHKKEETKIDNRVEGPKIKEIF